MVDRRLLLAGAGALAPEDFHLPRPRYVDPVPYPLEEFEQAYRWMLSWGLIQPNAAFDRLVDNRIGAAIPRARNGS